MKDPVPGTFNVSDSYEPHSGTSSVTMLTGVITAPGVPPTPAELRADSFGRWGGRQVLPITVDRADPANFTIDWHEIGKPDYQQRARRRAEQDAATMAEDQGAAAASAPDGGSQSPYGVAGEMLGRYGFTSDQIGNVLRSRGFDPEKLMGGGANYEVFGAPGRPAGRRSRPWATGFP